jgi:hypothetical protein
MCIKVSSSSGTAASTPAITAALSDGPQSPLGEYGQKRERCSKLLCQRRATQDPEL